MAPNSSVAGHGCCARPLALLSRLFFLVNSSYAQTSASELATHISALATTALPITSGTVASTDSLRTFASSLSMSASISSRPAQPTETPIDLFPVGTPQSGDHDPDEAAFNYYFLFLAAFGGAVCVVLWWLHRRRRKRKQQMRLNGQHALAQDLEGLAGARRFLYGRYHGGTLSRREEGLDEHGEAPPPYQPKNETTVVVEPAISGVTIPLRTLPRDAEERGGLPSYSSDQRGIETQPTTSRLAEL